MKYYIIAGEASGDLIASDLMKELKLLDPEAKFRCWGGDKMQAQGGDLVKHYRELSFMGFTEVAMNIRTILKNMKYCKKDILEYHPDVILLVDYPGFNLRIAGFANKHDIKVYYYISPQVWAWKKSRVNKIKRTVDRMFVILPFEKDFYRSYGYEVDFVGHPLLDVLPEHFEKKVKTNFFERYKLEDKPVIAILPGSRRQEVSKMLNIMIKLVPLFKECQFVIGGEPSIPREFYHKITGDLNVRIVFDGFHELLQSAEAAIVTSGTATLETALMNIPEVVCYKGSYISYHIARHVVNVKYISLVNLIMDHQIVKELIQYDLNVDNLKEELISLLYDKNYRNRMIENFKSLREKLGSKGASRKTAELMIDYLSQ